MTAGRRVLLVDDEPRILDALRRTLRDRYPVTFASSGAQALDELRAGQERGEPFAVVVSDMMMPGMSGAELLATARGVDPDLVLMVLSGQADLTSTIAAVNDANLFRFLTKPCDPADLTRALDAALRQHELVRAERDLLERTLGGAVDVLTEVLSLATPAAAARTDRVRTLTTQVSVRLGLTDDWRLPLAAMLSQVGCVAVPGEVLDAVSAGRALPQDAAAIYRAHPALAQRLVARIPRLGVVADWVGAQVLELPAAGPEQPAPPTVDREALARAAFCAVTGFLAGYDAGVAPRDTVRALATTGRFPQAVLDAVLDASSELAPKGRLVEVTASGVRAGMVLDGDVMTTTGLVLVRSGEKVTEVIASRIENFHRSVGVVEPLRVLVVG